MSRAKLSRELQFFDSHQEADKASQAYYAALSNQERLDLALELMSGFYETYPRFERIYRTAELGECPASRDWRLGI